ncbi:MAG: hypothetical protein ABSD56_00670 [Bryobacteraceae bacterium]
MLKTAFISAFALTLVTYAVFGWLQPTTPLNAAETTVIFAAWFGISALLRWLTSRRKRGGKGAR